MGLVKVGVIGGTFDPPHLGHLAIAQHARRQLELHHVIFVPAGQPWLKMEMPVSPAVDRFEMVRLAIAPWPYFEISRIEIDRAGPSYTYDTIKALRAGLKRGVELFFILGWDSLTQLPRWHEAKRLVRLCRLAAVPRPGYVRPGPGGAGNRNPGHQRARDHARYPGGRHLGHRDPAACRRRPAGRRPGPAAGGVVHHRSTVCTSRGSALQTSAPTWFRSLHSGPIQSPSAEGRRNLWVGSMCLGREWGRLPRRPGGERGGRDSSEWSGRVGIRGRGRLNGSSLPNQLTGQVLPGGIHVFNE